MPVGLLRNGFGMAPDTVHTLLMEGDIPRQEHSKQLRNLSRSPIFIKKGRMRAGLSFTFSIMPISLTLQEDFFLRFLFIVLHKTWLPRTIHDAEHC